MTEKKIDDVDLEQLTANVSIARAIVDISKGYKIMLESGLNERAMCILLHDATGVSLKQIKVVLHALPKLKDLYCTRFLSKEERDAASED